MASKKTTTKKTETKTKKAVVSDKLTIVVNIKGFIGAANPHISLSKEDRSVVYSTRSGKEIGVEPGKYIVSVVTIPDALKDIPPFGFAYAEPKFHISEVIEVAKDGQAFDLAPTYDCWAFVPSKDVGRYLSRKNTYANYQDIKCLKEGVVYIWIPGASAKNGCDILAVSKDGERQTVRTIAWGLVNGIPVQNGKWYSFPVEGKIESGDIADGLPIEESE